jgi:hypothetical protein
MLTIHLAVPMGITPTLFWPKSQKLEFSLFHSSVSQKTDISSEDQGREYGTPRQASRNYLIKNFRINNNSDFLFYL